MPLQCRVPGRQPRWELARRWWDLQWVEEAGLSVSLTDPVSSVLSRKKKKGLRTGYGARCSGALSV